MGSGTAQDIAYIVVANRIIVGQSRLIGREGREDDIATTSDCHCQPFGDGLTTLIILVVLGHGPGGRVRSGIIGGGHVLSEVPDRITGPTPGDATGISII